MFVVGYDNGRLLALWNRDRSEFIGIETRIFGGLVSGLRGKCETVGILPAYAEFASDIVSRLRHRIRAKRRRNRRVRETRSDRRIEHLEIAAERRFCLAHHIRSPAHALDAAGHIQITFATAHRSRSIYHGRHATRTQTVDRHSRCRGREARQQQRVTRTIAAVLSRLASTTEDYVLNLLRLNICPLK